jgi:hypothetical protein
MMIDVNEILAAFFQKRSVSDSDGVFHYLLRERDGALVVDITPYGPQWTPDFLKDTLIIDCIRDEICLNWGDYRATLGSFPVETLLFRDDEDDKRLIFVCADIVATINFPPYEALQFRVDRRDFFYNMIYEEQIDRVLSA